MNTVQTRSLLNMVSFVGIFMTAATALYLYHLGVFQDVNALQSLVGKSPLMGPVVFVMIQIVQVIIPIIPGGVSLAAGVLIFGPIQGFIYNYLGITMGSLIIFLLGRHYGKPFVEKLVSEKVYNKYSNWLEDDKRFAKLFALAIFFPVAPDDALCLLASLTNISFKKYAVIIFLAKPFSIYLYSLALMHGWTFLTQLLG